jgi:uncharacterized RDD family membrane protein YckC
VSSALFTGPSSLRHPRERLAFVLVLLWAAPIAALIGFFLRGTSNITQIVSQVALFVVITMVYVTLKRGNLIGSSVMIHEAQSPRVFSIVKKACAALEIPMPLIFVREELQIPVAALGFGEPYSLVISSDYIDHFEDDEFAFIVGRQLGHIAAGHTRFHSLLSTNGNENAIVALIFGPWLRVCELTCDKVGLLVCGSVDAAARAIAVASFKHFGRKVDIELFAAQGREIASDNIMRWGEWLGAEPYATRRIAEMRAWAQTHQFATLEEWFLRDRDDEPPAVIAATGRTVEKTDCAGWWRRLTALIIDGVVVSALWQIFPSSWNIVDVWQKVMQGPNGHSTSYSFSPQYFLVMLYLFVLVGVMGQSFGMMIAGLRVVKLDFSQPGIARSFWRYVLAGLLFSIIIPWSFVNRRILLHDRWSKTRLITVERAMARVAAS